MFTAMNELAFATQFMSPMSTGLDNCKCKNQIDNSSLNLTTIQVHGSCRNSTVHFLQGTVNLSLVRKLSIWGCLCFPVTCIFVIKKLAVQVVLKYCRLETLMQLNSFAIWFGFLSVQKQNTETCD